MIPNRYRSAFASFVGLGQSERRWLVERLEKAEPKTLPDELAKALAKDAPIEERLLTEVIRMLASMYVAYTDSERPADDFAVELVTVAEQSSPELAEQIKPLHNELVASISKMLSLDETLGVTSKAVYLLMGHNRVLQSARMFTDVRPVFKKKVADGAAASVIVHNLRLNYYDGTEVREFYVALDNDNLEELQDLLDRARAKEEYLRATLRETPLHSV